MNFEGTLGSKKEKKKMNARFEMYDHIKSNLQMKKKNEIK